MKIKVKDLSNKYVGTETGFNSWFDAIRASQILDSLPSPKEIARLKKQIEKHNRRMSKK